MAFNIKEFILGVLAASSSIAVFWLWNKATPLVVEGKFENYFNLAAPVGGLIIAATLFSLTALFVKNKWIVYPAATLGTVTPYLFVSATKVAIVVLLASILFMVSAIHRIRKESKLSLGFSLTKFLKSGLPLYFTVASLVISTFFLSHLDEEKAISSLLPKSALTSTLKAFSGPITSLTGLPQIDPEETVNDALLGLAEGQLKSQGIDVSKLSKKEASQFLTSQKEELYKNFGFKLTGEEKAGEVLYMAVTKRIGDLLGPYKKYLPYASALAFFFAFKTITFPLYYLTLLITFLLIKLMISVNILRSEKQQIEAERLTL